MRRVDELPINHIRLFVIGLLNQRRRLWFRKLCLRLRLRLLHLHLHQCFFHQCNLQNLHLSILPLQLSVLKYKNRLAQLLLFHRALHLPSHPDLHLPSRLHEQHLPFRQQAPKIAPFSSLKNQSPNPNLPLKQTDL